MNYSYQPTFGLTPKVIVGSVMISSYSGSFTSKSSLALDTSEKFHNKRKFIYYNDIKDIQRVNE